jgi:HTH-type transcriptional regulator / antitoxin HigA
MEKRAMKHRGAAIPSAIAALPKSYLSLMGQFPLRPITSGAEYEHAAAIIYRLALREGKLDAGEQAYLDVLEVLIERYDRQHNSLDANDVSPTRVLRMLVEQAGMTVTELGRLLGSKGAASELLSGKRKEPSKSQIAKLCARFKVDASLFLLPAAKPANAA